MFSLKRNRGTDMPDIVHMPIYTHTHTHIHAHTVIRHTQTSRKEMRMFSRKTNNSK